MLEEERSSSLGTPFGVHHRLTTTQFAGGTTCPADIAHMRGADALETAAACVTALEPTPTGAEPRLRPAGTLAETPTGVAEPMRPCSGACGVLDLSGITTFWNDVGGTIAVGNAAGIVVVGSAADIAVATATGAAGIGVGTTPTRAAVPGGPANELEKERTGDTGRCAGIDLSKGSSCTADGAPPGKWPPPASTAPEVPEACRAAGERAALMDRSNSSSRSSEPPACSASSGYVAVSSCCPAATAAEGVSDRKTLVRGRGGEPGLSDGCLREPSSDILEASSSLPSTCELAVWEMGGTTT